MAFGYRREAGAARGYIHEETGHRLSRRQYDKYVEGIGHRAHLPGEGAMRDTQARLDAMQRELDRRSAQLSEREREIAERELALAQRERELIETGMQRKQHQNARQRRYNLVLDMYVREQRAKGVTINKNQAKASAEFKQVMQDIRGTRPSAKKRRDPNVIAREREARRRAFGQIGGAREFKELYEEIHGGGRRGRGNQMRRRNRG